MTRTRYRQTMLAATLTLATGLTVFTSARPASAGDGALAGTSPPSTTGAAQFVTASPGSSPTSTCQLYGSASGFGLLCSSSAAGQTLAELLHAAGIATDRKFCWDDPNLPDGFAPDPTAAPGAWWLHTCLVFEGAVLRENAKLTYEFVHLAPGTEHLLTGGQKAAVDSVTGRGQIPFLQVQSSPISSPRVHQDVAFSLLCDDRVICDATTGRFVTPTLAVSGVRMHAELIHLRVLPEGADQPGSTDCTGAGLPSTAVELDSTGPDPAVCRWRYDRSSLGAGGGVSGDRYPATVTAYWQIFFDTGKGDTALGLPYEKTTVTSVRVTEVQTLVVP